jgi:predicted Rossmann-fold nucleotide-binding protein
MRLIGVIGAGDVSEAEGRIAFAVGKEIAHSGFGLVCGGLGGVMEWACKGAKEGGAMGHARNVIIVQTAQAVIALPGGAGTLSEIALAMKVGTPVVALGNWDFIEGIERAKTPEEAVKKALRLARKD